MSDRFNPFHKKKTLKLISYRKNSVKKEEVRVVVKEKNMKKKLRMIFHGHHLCISSLGTLIVNCSKNTNRKKKIADGLSWTSPLSGLGALIINRSNR